MRFDDGVVLVTVQQEIDVVREEASTTVAVGEEVERVVNQTQPEAGQRIPLVAARQHVDLPVCQQQPAPVSIIARQPSRIQADDVPGKSKIQPINLNAVAQAPVRTSGGSRDARPRSSRIQRQNSAVRCPISSRLVLSTPKGSPTPTIQLRQLRCARSGRGQLP